MNSRLFVLIIGLFAQNLFAQTFNVDVVLEGLRVHPEGDKNVFASSFEYRDGQLFIVHVEPPINEAENGVNLRTVLRKGVRQDDGSWKWEFKVIETRTLLDSWHTQASVGLDKNGNVHVAYNMHNMPWQYSISRAPYDISTFDFRGQSVSTEDLRKVKYENKTPFADAGRAAIPGNQVTYPMFFNDRNGTLLVTYRYALKPAKPWEERGFAGGIARYDEANKRWSQIGGEVVISGEDVGLNGLSGSYVQKPFAYSPGYTVYLPVLAFDQENGMHVFWSWRKEQAGMDTVRPSYAYSPDGKKFFDKDGNQFSLPVSFSSAASISGSADRHFYAEKSVDVGLNKKPMAVLHPISSGRELFILDPGSGAVSVEKTPESAQVIVSDKTGRQWLFATGIKVFMRDSEKQAWQYLGNIRSGLCFPKAKYYAKESRFILHAKSCSSMDVSIFTFRR